MDPIDRVIDTACEAEALKILLMLQEARDEGKSLDEVIVELNAYIKSKQ